MRKIEDKVCGAFAWHREASLDNTRSDGNHLYLHGNMIAKWVDGEVYFSLAGWNTVTTRSRISAVALILHKQGVSCKRGVPYHNGVEISTEGWWIMRPASNEV